MKKIEICEDLGFCHGVRNAIWSSILSSESGKDIFILGNLIHNSRVLEELSFSKVKLAKSLEEIPQDVKVIIPAHGIKKEVFDRLKEKTIDIIDMTCPVVVRLRNYLIKYFNLGYFILLLGRKNHPEIVGVISYIDGGHFIVVEDIKELKEKKEFIKSKGQVVFLSQTTANYEKFIEISDYLKTLNINDLIIANTICPTVINRQRNTLELSKRSDLMIVVGDKRSSNTLSLFDICMKNSESILLESNKPITSDPLVADKIVSVNSIGMTAGTSTPYYVIEEFSQSIKTRIETNPFKPVLVIFGPTAVGKTEISEKIAIKLDGEIVSCDSMQMYKELQIGTAKPSLYCRPVSYHLLDFLSLNTNFSVAEYRKLADIAIQEIISRGKIPIIVGGSYLYLSSIIDGLFEIDKSFDMSLRKKLFDRAEKEGFPVLYNELLTVDRETGEKVNRNDLKRVIRALEIYELTGEKISSLRKEKTFPLPYFYIKIGFVRPIEELYARINSRVDRMIKEGLIEEVKKLLNDGFEGDLERIKPHGYREIVSFLKGEIGLDEACDQMKKNTRNYAKRQLSWLRQRSDFHLLNLSPNSLEESVNSTFRMVEYPLSITLRSNSNEISPPFAKE